MKPVLHFSLSNNRTAGLIIRSLSRLHAGSVLREYCRFQPLTSFNVFMAAYSYHKIRMSLGSHLVLKARSSTLFISSLYRLLLSCVELTYRYFGFVSSLKIQNVVLLLSRIFFISSRVVHLKNFIYYPWLDFSTCFLENFLRCLIRQRFFIIVFCC